ncbi:MAG: hypothetical protein CBC48_10510 [bacterium TMED88]|nr:MAG: hypothetical protein CBC48_10510 [bacterium TMED88]
MEKQEFGFYVVHFFDQTYGIVNLDYIFEIEAVKADFSRPFRYLMGLEKTGMKDDDIDNATRLNNLFKNFKVTRDTFYEMIYFLKHKEYSQFYTDLKQIYLLGVRLGIGHMADLCLTSLKNFQIPNSSEYLDMEDDSDTEEYLQDLSLNLDRVTALA